MSKTNEKNIRNKVMIILLKNEFRSKRSHFFWIETLSLNYFMH